MPHEHIEELNKRFAFYTWQKVDDTHSAVRIVAGWATGERDVQALVDAIREL